MTSSPAPTPEKIRRALLLIDFQRDFLADDGRMPAARGQVAPVLAAARAALDEARASGDLIIAIGNEFRPFDLLMNLFRRGAAIAGSPGAAWDPRLPLDGVIYLPKWGGDAFGNPDLERLLRAEGVEEVTLTGLMAQACVSDTARGAMARGLRVRVLAGAVACFSDKSRAAAFRRLERRGALVTA
jgi:nicotinamidase-related amidase